MVTMARTGSQEPGTLFWFIGWVAGAQVVHLVLLPQAPGLSSKQNWQDLN